MNKNSNFLYLMVAILAVAIGYFYIDKTNPEFFQNSLNKISNKEDSGWEDEAIPQETTPQKPKEEVEP